MFETILIPLRWSQHTSKNTVWNHRLSCSFVFHSSIAGQALGSSNSILPQFYSPGTSRVEGSMCGKNNMACFHANFPTFSQYVFVTTFHPSFKGTYCIFSHFLKKKSMKKTSPQFFLGGVIWFKVTIYSCLTKGTKSKWLGSVDFETRDPLSPGLQWTDEKPGKTRSFLEQPVSITCLKS